jgi:formate--tetrahydrofolate ligase
MSAVQAIQKVAADLGIASENLLPYGNDKAKVRLDAEAESGRAPGKLILVSAMTPTGAGEGKTTTSIGLAQGLAKIGESVCLALREPSLGPTFGMKGGATGGGKSVLTPAADINLHFTGDFHAITYAHNMLTALIDNHVHHKLLPWIDSRKITWGRVIDLNERTLRHTITGLGGLMQGVPRETGFDITPASEVMAVLCLASDSDDLRARLSRLIVADTDEGQALTAGDIGAVGSMMVLLKDALLPNLVQTIEGVPAFIHGGPFANIAHGCNSIIATKMAMAHADWTITEAGFGFALGAEKFFNIKCRTAGLNPAAVVLVATVRALKTHGGVTLENLKERDPAAVERGLDNLRKHVESIRTFESTPIVAINRFGDDSDEEIEVIRKACEELDVPCAVADIFARGGDGGKEIAQIVVDHASGEKKPFRPLYDWESPIKDKMFRIASSMYGAGSVNWQIGAEKDIKRIEQLGFGNLPLCVAKTPASLSGNPKLLGRPEGFEISVRNVVLSAGAGYLVPLVGNILRMPGLPASPQANRMDLVNGKVQGLLGS